MRLQFEFGDGDFDRLWHIAVRKGNFLRENPRKSWTREEQKECIRDYVTSIVRREISEDKNRA